MKKQLAKMGSRFAFEFFLESMRPRILEGLRNYLRKVEPDGLRDMIKLNRFPDVKNLNFAFLADNTEHLEHISALRLMEFLAEARPDLAQTIMEAARPGADYLAALRRHLLDRIKAAGSPLEDGPIPELAQATCDKCGKSWPVEKSKSGAIDKCVFCGE